MESKYLIDTDVIIKYLNETLSVPAISFINNIIDNECDISFINKIELLVWKTNNNTDLQILREFIEGITVHYVNHEIIEKTILIRKTTNIKIPDAVIAATALVYGFTLLSANDKDFLKVKKLGLKYINPEKK